MASAPQVGAAAREGVDYMPTPTEQRSGKRWVDGRPIWQITIPWHSGAFDAGPGMVDHFLPNVANFIGIEGVIRTAAGVWTPITNYAPTVNNLRITITNTAAHTQEGWVTLYYVRTTDPIPLRTD